MLAKIGCKLTRQPVTAVIVVGRRSCLSLVNISLQRSARLLCWVRFFLYKSTAFMVAPEHMLFIIIAPAYVRS